MSSVLPVDRSPRGALSRQRILDNAARLFRANGYAATSLGDIAAASGMRTASLYYHFASKEALVTAMLQISAERTSAAAAAAVAALPVEAPFAARLAAAIAAHLEQLLGHADYTSADLRIINQVPESVRRVVLPIRQDYARWWQSLLEQGRRAGAVRPDCDLKLVRMLLLGALNWASEWYKPDRGPVAPIARECARLVVGGIATTGAGSACGDMGAEPGDATVRRGGGRAPPT
jgi:TetR/AcrR family transcriptional regulator, cholesterol catabolism regulator